MFTDKVSPILNEILNKKIYESANRFSHSYPTPKDLILCILERNTNAYKLLKQQKINIQDFTEELIGEHFLDKRLIREDLGTQGNLLKSTEHLLKLALDIAKKTSNVVDTEHVLVSFLLYHGDYRRILDIKNLMLKYGINQESLIKLAGTMGDNENNNNVSSEQEKENSEELDNKKREYKMEISLINLGFIENETLNAKRNKEKFIGRDEEIKRCIQILCRKKKKNPIIIGEGGVGKSHLVRGIAKKIIDNDVPKKLIGSEIFSVNISNIISGTKYRGQFEERMKKVMDFFDLKKENNKDPIIFFDEIHTIVGAGKAEGALDAMSMLKPKLANDDIQCIGTTTLSEYRKFFSKDSALERRFTPVVLNEPSCEEALEILKGIKKEYEEFHDINISTDILEKIVSYSDRYIKNRFFPDKAIDVLDEACSKVLIENPNTRKENRELVLEEILEIISEISKVPVASMDIDEKNKLRSMVKTLKKKIIGQDHAVERVSKTVQLSRIGLNDPDRPYGVFMFLGVTGTGKTHTAQCLSEAVFGKRKIIRLDMSEYMEKHSVAKIIGSPPGYVGYEEGGQLSERVKNDPYSVILLDEIEKADKDVLNLFLQVFDEGRLTDSSGSYIDFRNTIIIMTSNIAANKIGKEKHIGFLVPDQVTNQKEIEEFLTKEVKEYFSPEFINRIDDILVFNRLQPEDISEILNIELAKTKDRIKDQEFAIKLHHTAKTFLCEKGYQEELGARPMKRAIKKYIEEPLAERVLDGDIQKGDVVSISKEKGSENLNFTVKRK